MLKVLKELTGKGQAFPAFGAEEPDILRSRRSIQVSNSLLVYTFGFIQLALLCCCCRLHEVTACFRLCQQDYLKYSALIFFMNYRNGTRKIDCILRVISIRFFLMKIKMTLRNSMIFSKCRVIRC